MTTRLDASCPDTSLRHQCFPSPIVPNNRIAFLARLPAPKLPVLEFVFGFEPIVQFTVGLFPTFKIDVICATSHFLVTCQILYLKLEFRRRRLGCFLLLTCTSLC